MQVTYQQTFDDWVAAQIFSFEQLSALRKHEQKILRNLVIFAVSVAVVFFFIGEADAFYWFFTAVFAFWIGYLVIKQSTSKQRMLSQRLLLAYGPEFEKEQDKTVAWHVGPEAIIVADSKKEIRYLWNAIRQIVVCPDYLFVKFGGLTGWLQFPGCAVPETAYQALCEDVIRLYREHAAKEGKIAEVVHSDWAIDLDKFKKKKNPARRWTLRKFLFSILWAVILVAVFTCFCGILFVASAIAAVALEERTAINTEPWAGALAFIWFFGSLAMFIGAIVLTHFGILPGTKATSTS